MKRVILFLLVCLLLLGCSANPAQGDEDGHADQPPHKDSDDPLFSCNRHVAPSFHPVKASLIFFTYRRDT